MVSELTDDLELVATPIESEPTETSEVQPEEEQDDLPMFSREDLAAVVGEVVDAKLAARLDRHFQGQQGHTDKAIAGLLRDIKAEFGEGRKAQSLTRKIGEATLGEEGFKEWERDEELETLRNARESQPEPKLTAEEAQKTGQAYFEEAVWPLISEYAEDEGLTSEEFAQVRKEFPPGVGSFTHAGFEAYRLAAKAKIKAFADRKAAPAKPRAAAPTDRPSPVPQDSSDKELDAYWRQFRKDNPGMRL